MTTVIATDNSAQASELGKTTQYEATYNPDRLFGIPRAGKRQEIGVDPKALPFNGFDYWNHYEVSWLNHKGKPQVAIAEIVYDCTSPCIVESKSLKLYFNSLNNTAFASADELTATITTDLEKVIGAKVQLTLKPLTVIEPLQNLAGECIDDLDISCDTYTVDPSLLTVNDTQATETLYSNLLKSNCLVTQQPDWGSVQICYRGSQIDRAGLLRYIVSFRNHNEFHEQCIERIFIDIMQHCQPQELTVYGRYTRRGGLDINPYRSTHACEVNHLNTRLVRQ